MPHLGKLMKIKYILSLLTTVTVSFSAFAEGQMVAKVVLMRGMVKAKLATGEVQDVKADQSLPEGAVLQTAEKSFVKLLFIDKSQMNLGPNSQMIINTFPKKEPGIITLVKGQIRSQVTKDYMEMDDKSKSKLYIKTKTAAMGIRGTDFQVNYNAENNNTSLITFEGKVAMASIEKATQTQRFDQSALEKVVSSEKAVMVEKGQVSAVNLNVAERAMLPTKLGTKQIEALENNETGVKESKVAENEKQYKNPIPPGADGAAFSNTSPELEKEVMKMSPASAANFAKKMEVDNSDPNGYFNEKTGEYKLPAGSIIDLSTVNIIPPPTNAVYDPNSNTYVVPENFGKIDKVTGEYKAPEGLKLGADGKFVLVDAEAYQKSQAVNEAEKTEGTETKTEEAAGTGDKPAEGTTTGTDTASTETTAEGERAPASVAPAPVEVKLEVPKLYDASPAMLSFAQKYAASPIAPPPPPPTNNTLLQTLATETMQKTETVRQRESDLGIVSPTTKVKIILNAQ